MDNLCPQCGAPVSATATKCEYCGAPLQQAPVQQVPVQQAPVQQVVYVQQGIDKSRWPLKSKIAAGILAILLGSIGIHKFYLGQVGAGIMYLLFCWTMIPGIIGLIEGIMILCSNDENFELKYRCRVK